MAPYLSDLLHNGGWRYGAIGVAASMPGFGVCLLQPVAGLYLDRSRHERVILATACIAVGACYAALPSLLAASHLAMYATLFASGLAQALFGPLLAGLALGLVGHGHLDRTFGANQASSHLGDVTAALLALLVIRGGIARVFYLVGVIAVLASLSALLIDQRELDADRASGGTEARVPFRALLRTPSVLVLLASCAMTYGAYASAFPFVVLRVRQLGNSDALVAAMVLVTMTSMTPVAILAGRSLKDLGRKPVFAVGFFALPAYLLACGLVSDAFALVALQALGSVGPGILGVVMVVVCADLTKGTGHFHALTAAARTATAGGAVVGPFATGFVVEHLGYEAAFVGLAGVATAAALLFVSKMPETRPDRGVS
jgi:predicted MFS family arabinose efflux permease